MRLVDVYSVTDAADTLWGLLAEREPHQSISHRRMPTLQQHLEFIERRPYAYWYVIDAGAPDYVGAVYLTHQREIGVGILRAYQRQRFARSAVRMLIERHPGRFLWNVNPANAASVALCQSLGFRPEPIQHTYEREFTP
jgi:RimJ/RimL family protein N-acetyltransferase